MSVAERCSYAVPLPKPQDPSGAFPSVQQSRLPLKDFGASLGPLIQAPLHSPFHIKGLSQFSNPSSGWDESDPVANMDMPSMDMASLDVLGAPSTLSSSVLSSDQLCQVRSNHIK